MRLCICWQWQCLHDLSPFARYSQSKCTWPWPWPLEWANVKYKYANGMAICDFLLVENSNVCPICDCLWDTSQNVAFRMSQGQM